ncbi:hypothetical protein RhiirA5_496000 [Rhizophagus irregularis]|uniref:HMG box domain-containing protein n=1 Tax=Rhizophagus irregularis TaxID=588596 RepID=A0A2N0SF60_9GLOM|nr:hypothetical protein RhiirA5_496000 [Rhizophagus irregularis]PKC74198.1 hypothetical protein RhiirA1_529777 [Rhizophagus irregularis]
MIIICDPNKKKEHFPNAFLIYRALTWKLYKKNSPNVKQQNYSVATGGRWKDVPNEIRNVYTQLSIKLSEDNHVPDGFLIFRAISWETLKERYPNATIASEEWDRLPSEDKTFYIKLYEELSEATKKKKILKSKLKKQKSKRVQKPQINSQNLTDQSPHFPYNDGYEPKEEDNISIVAVISTTTDDLERKRRVRMRLSSKSTADAISEAERLFDLYFQDLVNVAKNAYESYSYFEAPEKNCNKKFIDDKKISQTVILGTSGCGKTRLCFEALCQNYGLYLVVLPYSVGSVDLEESARWTRDKIQDKQPKEALRSGQELYLIFRDVEGLNSFCQTILKDIKDKFTEIFPIVYDEAQSHTTYLPETFHSVQLNKDRARPFFSIVVRCLSTLSYSFIGAFDCITGSGLSLLRVNDKISTKAKEELQ